MPHLERSRLLALALVCAFPASAWPAPDFHTLLDQIHFRSIGPTRQGGRVVALAMNQDDPLTFFIAGGPGGLYKTTNGGQSFTATFEHGGVASIGDAAIASSGCDESRDGGRTWQRCFRFGGDSHALWINPEDSRHWLLGYDYGMAITRDSGATWYHPDELSLAQVYAVSIDDAHPYNVYVGLQDFGSWRGPSTKKGRFPIRFEDWEHMNGANDAPRGGH